MLRLATVGVLFALATQAHASGRSGPSGDAPAYRPAPGIASVVGEVLASFYGHHEKLNRRTSTGEVFNPLGLTAAHRTLPFGTMLRVAYAGNEVVVRVNDRGPAEWTGRALDLSYGAAMRLGFVPQGTAHVIVTVLN